MYQEIISSNGIKNGIESFWVFKETRNKVDFKVLPDSCIDLIFDLSEYKIFISGIMTQYQNRNLNKDSNIIGIRMRAECLPYLSEIPIGEFQNKRVELSNLNTVLNSSIRDIIYEPNSLKDKLNCLETFILKEQHQYRDLQDDLILVIANEIRKLKGNIKVKELAKSYFISLRQLERRFKRHMGITLKAFSNIIRFKNAKRRIANNNKTSLLEIAFDMGYYDHAHMNNDFKRIAGEKPSSFR